MKRKTMMILGLVLLNCEVIFAQKNQFEANIGPAFFGSGDMLGRYTAFRYDRMVAKRISVFGQISYSYGQKMNPSDNPNNPLLITFRSNSSLKANIGVGLNVLKIKDTHFLNVSPSLGFIKSSVFRAASYYLAEPFIANRPLERQYAYNPPEYREVVSIGYGLGLDYKVKVTNAMFLGTGIILQNYKKSGIEWGLFLSTAFRI